MFNHNLAIGKIPVLSFLTYAGFIFVVVLALAITSMRYTTLTGLQAYAPDLFLSFQDIFPAQPEEVLATYNCPTRASLPANRPAVNHTANACFIFPHSSAFHLINIIIKYNRIQETSFYSEYLQVNQLIAQWETPPTILKTGDQRTLTLQWDRGDYLVTAVIPKTLGTSVVRLVTFTHK